MSIREAYNNWSAQYDQNDNKTRDLEAKALMSMLAGRSFRNCLEIGCGTGKNTVSLLTICEQITAVDFSEKMLEIAKQKINTGRVVFTKADIQDEWTFGHQFDLVTFSLVLEHIQHLERVFSQASKALVTGGILYVGELHPFKQYTGSKARFNEGNETHVVQCYNHHISDFTNAAKKNGLTIIDLQEFFDDDDRDNIPRILSILLQKL
jgi:ubiquinone/menaquinone biosynthesis C-methylase UbiE